MLDIQTHPHLRSSSALTDGRKKNVAQVGIEYKCGQLHTCKQGTSPEIRTSTHWHLTGRSVTAPLPVLSHNNILPILPALILI
jgi:hypothetical protein